MLTQLQILHHLQIANCCGAKKINAYIDNMKNGVNCVDYLVEANILFGYIDSLKCYKLYNESPSVSATDTIFIDYFGSGVVNGTPLQIHQNGSLAYTGTLSAGFFVSIMDQINTALLRSIGGDITATYDPNVSQTFLFTYPCSKNGGDHIQITIDNNVFVYNSVFSEGSCTYPYIDCITYEQVLNIFSAIGKICNGNCTDYVNFQLN